MINLIDLVVVAAVLIGLANGYRRGFWLSLAQYAGLLVGVILGALAAKPVLDYLQINNPVARPLGAVLVLVIGGSLGSSIGFAAGEPIRRRILRTGIHTATDSAGGAALSAVAVLMMCWFLGISFSRGPSQEVARQIQRSAVLHVLDSIDRTPPPFMASVEGIVSGVSFPPVFAGLEPALPGALPIPASVDTAGVSRAAQSVVKVTSLGCGGLVTGSGFPLGNGYVITNRDGDGKEYKNVAAPVQFNETPPEPARAPEHGQHTEEILLELDLGWDDILRAKESGEIL